MSNTHGGRDASWPNGPARHTEPRRGMTAKRSNRFPGRRLGMSRRPPPPSAQSDSESSIHVAVSPIPPSLFGDSPPREAATSVKTDEPIPTPSVLPSSDRDGARERPSLRETVGTQEAQTGDPPRNNRRNGAPSGPSQSSSNTNPQPPGNEKASADVRRSSGEDKDHSAVPYATGGRGGGSSNIEVIDLTSEPAQSPPKSPRRVPWASPVRTTGAALTPEKRKAIEVSQNGHSPQPGTPRARAVLPTEASSRSAPQQPGHLLGEPAQRSSLDNREAPAHSAAHNHGQRVASATSLDRYQDPVFRASQVLQNLTADGPDISIVNKALPRVLNKRPWKHFTNDEFDSDAFDAQIYQQAGSKPPPGIHIPSAPSHTKPPPPPGAVRMYLHINPAIHRLHNKSKEWHEQKAREIQARGGRKAWFGKAAERERWLRAKEEAEASNAARPWGHKLAVDFSEVPEEDLPEDVLRDPAWVKACEWHRQTKDVALMRKQRLRQSKKETRQFYLDFVNKLPPMT